MQKLTTTQLSMSSQELERTSKVRLNLFSNLADLFEHFARSIADLIKTNNQTGNPTRLILPVGPVLQYPRLVEICNRERISWKNVHSFNMDEYCDWQGRQVPKDHPLSFRAFMERALFGQLHKDLSIPPDQIHFPDPLNVDAISKSIADAGGIDRCYGGIGYHGHVAFNEPPYASLYALSAEQMRNSLTRLVVIRPDTMVMNSIRNFGGDSSDFPPIGVTLGMRDILAARSIRMYCPGGEWQRYVLRVACLGSEDVDYPATLLQGHPDYEVVSDLVTAAPVEPSLGL